MPRVGNKWNLYDFDNRNVNIVDLKKSGIDIYLAWDSITFVKIVSKSFWLGLDFFLSISSKYGHKKTAYIKEGLTCKPSLIRTSVFVNAFIKKSLYFFSSLSIF